MSKALLSLVLPAEIAQQLEDLLLENPELVSGFTTGAVDGHGHSVRLTAAAELVSGHSPRLQFQIVGEPARLQAVLALVRENLPQAGIFYWLVPVLESGRIS